MDTRIKVESLTGATYSVCAGVPATFDAAGYAALVYTVIGDVESVSPFGANRPITKFTPINGAVQNVLGTPEFGSLDFVTGDVPSDVGQIILTAGEENGIHHSIRTVFTDGETFYYDVLVASVEHQGAKAGDVKTVSFKCPINGRPVRVAPV